MRSLSLTAVSALVAMLPAAARAQDLTLAALANARYNLPQGSFVMRDGAYTDPQRGFTVNLRRPSAFGDIDGDGRADAVVTLATNTGGAATYVSLAVVVATAMGPRHAANLGIAYNGVVESLTVNEGRIRITAIRQGPNDQVCCPTLRGTITVALRNGQLQRVPDDTPVAAAAVAVAPAPAAAPSAPVAPPAQPAVAAAPAVAPQPALPAYQPARTRAAAVGRRGRATPALRTNVTPDGIAVDGAGNVFFTDNQSVLVRRLGTDRMVSTVAGAVAARDHSGDGGQALDATLTYPADVAIDAAGVLYILDLVEIQDYVGVRIRRVTPDGIISTLDSLGPAFPGYGQPPLGNIFGYDDEPGDMTVDPQGNVYVIDRGESRVWRIDPRGAVHLAAGTGRNELALNRDPRPAIQVPLNHPTSLAADNDGNVYIVDHTSVRRLDAQGRMGTVTAPSSYSSVVVDPSGGVFLVDGEEGRIDHWVPGGEMTVRFRSTRPARAARGLVFPHPKYPNPGWIGGMAADAQGNLYVADPNGNFIRKIDVNGVVTTVAGTGRVSHVYRDEGP